MRFRLPAHLIHVAVAVTVAVAGLPAAAAAQTAPPGQHPPAANAAAAAANAAAAPGPREFFYDAGGQLAGVTDPATGSAAYRYDDAGNLLRTERIEPGAVAVFALVPARGPVGSSIEIGGAGFSATTSANEVTVDGIAAAVSRATTGRLRIQIPSGATDGVVKVSVGGHSATSPRPFRVEDGAPVPGITTLSTDRGNKNDLVTITGTGFDTDPARNVVMFHRTTARVQEASATTLKVRVPAAAQSGKVSVRTAGGTAESAGDFYVAPRGFVMSDLVPSGRIKAGSPALTVTVPAGKAALVLIDGVAGENLNLKFDGNTVPKRSALWLYQPYGGNFARGVLGDPLDLWSGGPLSQDLPKLTATGTYAMVIKPNDGASGSMRITASNTLSGTALTADGSGVPFQITVPQQPFQTTFAATANQWMSFGLTELSEPANTYVVKVTAPDNSVFTWQASLTRYTPTMVFKPKQTGTYKLSITFGANELGFGRVWLSTVINGATMTVNGSSVPVAIQRPGQSVRLPFAGTTGQVLQLGYTDNTLQQNDRPAYPAAIMVEPDEVQVTLETGWAESRDIPTLRKTGQHSIFVTGWHAVGGLNAWLSTRAEGGELPVNAMKTVTVDRPGRDVWLDFNGVQGRPLHLGTTDRSLPGEVNLRLYKPDGFLVSLGSGRSIDIAALPVTGKYRLQVDPESAGKGTLAVVAAEPRNVGALTPDAPATKADVALPGQRIVATFTGTAGQRLSFGATGDIDFVLTRIYKPDNAQLDFWGTIDLRYGIDLPALPAAGTYRIELTPNNAGTGAYNLLLSSELNLGKAEVGGAAKSFTIARPGQNGLMTFDGTAGVATQITLSNLNLGGNTIYFTVLDPAGAVLARRWRMYYFTELLPSLPTTGTYTLIFDPGNGATGSFDMAVHRKAAAAAAKAPFKEEPGTAGAVLPSCVTGAEQKPALSAPVLQQPGEPAAAPAPPPATAPACEDTGWTPDAKNLAGVDWSTRRAPAPTRERALQFPAGVTGVVGRVLATGGNPLGGVTVSARGKTTTTGADGRFALAGLPSGHLALRVDGRSTTGTARGTYGVFDIGVDVTHGEVLVLPYTVFLPKIDVRATVSVPSPTTREVVLTTKAIPGLEVHIPKGTVIRDADGNVAHELSLTPIPIDRPPFPLPPTRVPVYFSVQPGGGVLFPEGARIVYPNYTREAPGTRTQFWNYDPDVKGWHLYGLGTVTPDGKQIVPDPDVKFYRLTGAMTAVPGMNPAQNAPRPNGARVGDPVDPSTGLLVDETVDLTVDDIVPIEIKRTYQQGDVDTRAFGVGTNFDYGLFPWSPGQIGNFDFQQFDLVQPDGSKIHYFRTSPGNDYAGAIFKADPTPTRYDGSTVAWNGDGWDVKLRDGTVYVLGDESPVQEIRDKFGNTTTITRATAAPGTDGKVRLNGAVTQITSPNGRWVKFSYDQANPPKITSIEDNIGRKVGYTYDTGNRLSTVTDTRGGVTRYTWENGLLKSITDPRGTEYLVNTYDANKRVKTQKGPDGGLITFDYVTSGTSVTETTMTDPEGNKRRFTFNAQGQVLTDTKAYGTSLAQTTTTTYDTSGVRRAATVDALNRRTAYTYNAAGQVNKITVLDGTAQARSETFDWTGPYAELTKHTDGYGKATVYEIDGKGYLKSVTDRQNRKSLVTTDAAGQVTRLTDPAGKAVTTVYAGSDAVQTTDEAGNISRTAYDGIGRPVRATDGLGVRTDTTVDAAGLVRAVTDGLGRTTRFDYDANGNRTEVTDARGGTTHFGYNNRDQVETVTDPAGQSEAYEYDLNGNADKHTSRRGVVTENAYDELDRLQQRTVAGGGTIAYGYDAGNRLRRTEDSVSGVVTTDYDDLDRITGEGTPQGSVAYSYTAAVRDRTLTVAGRTATRHLYDANGALQEIQQGGTAVTTVGRDVTGRAERVGAPSTGISQTYAYTDAGQVKTITYRNGTTVLGDLGYEYDAAGRPIRVTGTYSRTALPPEFGPATYDAANRIEKVADTAVTHDADGNITSDGVTTYTWNARGELAALSGADRSASFTYATDGRRTGRTVNGATTTYLYDGTNPLQESVNGAVTATMTSAGTDGFQLRESGGTTRRYLTDALGSTVGLVDTTGAGAAYSYEPFGATTVTGTDNGNPYRYTGREDDGTGLYFYRERYYSPVLQRFLSEDPIGFAGGLNLYAYVSNQPTLLTDPTGEKPANPGGGSGGTGDDGYIPGYYLLDKGFKAPKQTTPGTRVIEGTYNNNRGPGGERQEPWTAHYDQYGRLIGRTDYNAGLPGQGIPDTHYHRFVYGPGKNGHEIEKHVPGEFTP
ncbi:RHS repeat-associated core domain-containing protein [Actinoplanes sp. NPDC023801]|uniref:RHS repeat-associated core domain-containing protein n=1 Tax=Actinoplanes sp. NPDC023801 TaxID=3154595 RepID=UPI0033D14A26